jgi:hypothetical protein
MDWGFLPALRYPLVWAQTPPTATTPSMVPR